MLSLFVNNCSGIQAGAEGYQSSSDLPPEDFYFACSPGYQPSHLISYFYISFNIGCQQKTEFIYMDITILGHLTAPASPAA
jgi:hypothetical protein